MALQFHTRRKIPHRFVPPSQDQPGSLESEGRPFEFSNDPQRRAYKPRHCLLSRALRAPKVIFTARRVAIIFVNFLVFIAVSNIREIPNFRDILWAVLDFVSRQNFIHYRKLKYQTNTTPQNQMWRPISFVTIRICQTGNPLFRVFSLIFKTLSELQRSTVDRRNAGSKVVPGSRCHAAER